MYKLAEVIATGIKSIGHGRICLLGIIAGG
jgi:hypothetical protein